MLKQHITDTHQTQLHLPNLADNSRTPTQKQDDTAQFSFAHEQQTQDRLKDLVRQGEPTLQFSTLKSHRKDNIVANMNKCYSQMNLHPRTNIDHHHKTDMIVSFNQWDHERISRLRRPNQRSIK